MPTPKSNPFQRTLLGACKDNWLDGHSRTPAAPEIRVTRL